jgi:hypothetical protein
MDKCLLNMDVDVIQVETSKNQLQYCEGRKAGNLCIRNILYRNIYINEGKALPHTLKNLNQFLA